jgi:hypothetical protein
VKLEQSVILFYSQDESYFGIVDMIPDINLWHTLDILIRTASANSQDYILARINA